MKVSYSSNVLTLTQNQNRPQSASKWSPCAQIPFPVTHRVVASCWIESRKLSSDRLANVYLERIAIPMTQAGITGTRGLAGV